MIFKYLVVVIKSQEGVKLPKFGTSYLIFVWEYWCGMIKSSKNHHFWVRAHILIPPEGSSEPRRVLKMRKVVPQTSFLTSVHFLWPSLFIWFWNRTKKFGYHNPNFENRRDPKLDQRKDGGIIFGGCFMVGNCLSEMGSFWGKTNTLPCPLFLPPTNGWMDGWTDGHRKLKTWTK